MKLIEPPQIHIVLRYHNAFDLTNECLKSLSKCSYSNLKFLIVDDASSDGTCGDLIKSFKDEINIQSIRVDKYSDYCICLNRGIRYSIQNGADYVFVVNNDTKNFSTNFFEALIQKFNSDPNIGVIGSKVFDFDGIVRSDAKPVIRLGTTIPIPTEGYIFSKDTIKKVGLFDEKLVRHMEDFDYVIRCNLKKIVCTSINTVSFDHLGGGTSRYQIFYPHYYRMRNVVWFIKKYRSDWSLLKKLKYILGYFKHHLIKSKATFLAKYPLRAFLQIFFASMGALSGVLTKW
jgi:GT2 family glycosyltransferase